LTAGLPTEKEQPVFPVLIYFSLITLTTIGYGDITPLTMKTRYAAIAEGVTGQFYLAILVARLVGMQMSRSMSQQSGKSVTGFHAGLSAGFRNWKPT
jgi:Ion channel